MVTLEIHIKTLKTIVHMQIPSEIQGFLKILVQLIVLMNLTGGTTDNNNKKKRKNNCKSSIISSLRAK